MAGERKTAETPEEKATRQHVEVLENYLNDPTARASLLVKLAVKYLKDQHPDPNVAKEFIALTNRARLKEILEHFTTPPAPETPMPAEAYRADLLKLVNGGITDAEGAVLDRVLNDAGVNADAKRQRELLAHLQHPIKQPTEAMKKALEAHNNDPNQLEQAIEDVQGKIDEAKKAMESRNEERKELKGELTKAEAELSKVAQEVESLERRIVDLTDKSNGAMDDKARNAFDAERRAKESDLSYLKQNRLKNATEKRDKLEADLRVANDEYNKAIAAMNQSEGEKSTLEKAKVFAEKGIYRYNGGMDLMVQIKNWAKSKEAGPMPSEESILNEVNNEVRAANEAHYEMDEGRVFYKDLPKTLTLIGKRDPFLQGLGIEQLAGKDDRGMSKSQTEAFIKKLENPTEITARLIMYFLKAEADSRWSGGKPEERVAFEKVRGYLEEIQKGQIKTETDRRMGLPENAKRPRSEVQLEVEREFTKNLNDLEMQHGTSNRERATNYVKNFTSTTGGNIAKSIGTAGKIAYGIASTPFTTVKWYDELATKDKEKLKSVGWSAGMITGLALTAGITLGGGILVALTGPWAKRTWQAHKGALLGYGGAALLSGLMLPLMWSEKARNIAFKPAEIGQAIDAARTPTPDEPATGNGKGLLERIGEHFKMKKAEVARNTREQAASTVAAPEPQAAEAT